jgi:catechol 2,3-dioxygenase-like lactoylglutathione lyase family enzyme
VFSLDQLAPPIQSVVSRPGLMHIAFSVDDIEATLDRFLRAGGKKLGEPVEAPAAGGVPRAGFVYARDPDGNIVELLEWR